MSDAEDTLLQLYKSLGLVVDWDDGLVQLLQSAGERVQDAYHVVGELVTLLQTVSQFLQSHLRLCVGEEVYRGPS